MDLVFDSAGKKGQEFPVKLLACVEASSGFLGAETRDRYERRPLVMVLGTTHAAAAIVRANLLDFTALRVDGSTKTYSDLFLRDRAERWIVEPQHLAEGTVITVAHERLVMLDPRTPDERGAEFLVLPPMRWLEARRAHIGPAALRAAVRAATRGGEIPAMEPRAEDVVLAASWFAAMLETRVRLPLAPGLEFQARLLGAALTRGAARFCTPRPGTFGEDAKGWGLHGRFYATGLDAHRFGPAIAFSASHEAIEEMLTEVSMSCFGQTRRAEATKGQLALTA